MRDDYFIRQSDIVSLDALREPILIVGAGTIGSFTALALAKLGCFHIVIQDFDMVEEHNLSNQLYNAQNIGEYKAEALRTAIESFAPPGGIIESNLTPFNIGQDMSRYKVVVAAVDNMDARLNIFHTSSGRVFIDGRMGDNVLQIYTIGDDLKDQEFYSSTIFPDHEADPIPCSRRSVAYNGFIIGGYMALNIVRALVGKEVPREMILDLENYFLFK